MVGSWCPPISEVHGLAPHGEAVRSVLVFSLSLLVVSKEEEPSKSFGWWISSATRPLKCCCLLTHQIGFSC